MWIILLLFKFYKTHRYLNLVNATSGKKMTQHCSLSLASPAALPFCTGFLPLSAGQVLRPELRHWGQVGAVQQEARRLQILANVEGFGNQRAGAQGGQSSRHGQVRLGKHISFR